MTGNLPLITAQRNARPNKRLVAPLIALIICFAAICVYILADTRRVTFERAGDIASRLLTTIETDMARNLETLQLSLQAVIDNINRADVEALGPELRHLILFDRSAAARHLGAMLVADEAGNVILDSRSLRPPVLNVADRDYFQVHRDNADAGTFISRPFMSRLSDQPFVGVSRRLSHPDGSFAGVVVGSIRLLSFQTLFKDAALGPDSNITLSRTDGIVLMRWPYRPEFFGLDIRHAKVFEHLKRAASGRFIANATTDGVRRLVVYSKVGSFPLVVGIGQSTAEIFRQWHRDAVAVGLLVAALSLIGLTLAFRLFGELARRAETEAELAQLATIDPLTGIHNRRQFDRTLDHEWRRGARKGTSVSLLMIDVDRFKDYNDRYGHQAGDTLLRTLAECVAQITKRGGDIGARIGGDEFAILLPDTPVGKAVQVAEELRVLFGATCAGIGETTGLSIGAACGFPAIGGTQGDLVADADNALYEAKRQGRNRVHPCLHEPPVEYLPPEIRKVA